MPKVPRLASVSSFITYMLYRDVLLKYRWKAKQVLIDHKKRREDSGTDGKS
jgi:hypothetical protein